VRCSLLPNTHGKVPSDRITGVSQPQVLAALAPWRLPWKKFSAASTRKARPLTVTADPRSKQARAGRFGGGLVDRPQPPAARRAEREEHVVADLRAGGPRGGGDRRRERAARCGGPAVEGGERGGVDTDEAESRPADRLRGSRRARARSRRSRRPASTGAGGTSRPPPATGRRSRRRRRPGPRCRRRSIRRGSGAPRRSYIPRLVAGVGSLPTMRSNTFATPGQPSALRRGGIVAASLRSMPRAFMSATKLLRMRW
jgi:hypothetical protein